MGALREGSFGASGATHAAGMQLPRLPLCLLILCACAAACAEEREIAASRVGPEWTPYAQLHGAAIGSPRRRLLAGGVSVVNASGDGIEVADYRCVACLKDRFGTTLPVRVMYISDETRARACNNLVADGKLKRMGRTLDACNDPRKAIPECFVESNWDTGWICKVMHEVFRDMGAEVVVKTRANTTVTSQTYSGGSPFTRCVHEVKLGQVDLCIGEFWETSERRNLTAFTSTIDSDSMLLVSRPRSMRWLKDGSLLWVWADPFSWQVWVACLGTTILASLLFWAVELGYNDWPGAGGDDENIRSHRGLSALLHRFYLMLLGILHRSPIRAGITHESKSFPCFVGRNTGHQSH